MCPGFFYWHIEYRNRQQIANERQKAERNRDVINDVEDDYARRLERDRWVREEELIQNCWNEGELDRRLTEARLDIWYLPSLAMGDISKYEAVKRAYYIDAMKLLLLKIETS